MPAQPSNSWSVQLLNVDGTANGVALTLASLGIESASYDLNNLAADVLTFTVGGKAIDAATLWPYGTLLAVCKPDGTRFFVGRVEPWTRDGRPDSQNHLGRLVNPWWYLEHRIYEQRYKQTQFATAPVPGEPLPPSTSVTYSTPRVVLNILYDGDINGLGWYAATTGQQIGDAVNWAISLGAPIALGLTDPATLPFSDFQKGIFCADVIKLMFRKEPDFVMDWDYTTVPFPTVHFRKVQSLTPVNIDLTNTHIREQVSIKERPDWQRSYVKINYDQTNSTSGGSFLATYEDWYSALGQGNASNGFVTGAGLPVDTESRFRAVDLFCDLTGFSTSQTSQTASFASQEFDINTIATWQTWCPDLLPDPNGKGIVSVVYIEDGSNPDYAAPKIVPHDEYDENGNPVVLDPACIYEVVDGEWADWIPNVNAQRVRAVCYVKTVNKSGHVERKLSHHDMTVVSRNTGGVSTDFTTNQSTVNQYAEGIPAGLAKAMWTSWQNLAIEGHFTNVEAIVGTSQNITRSNCLNFLTASPGVAGSPDWRSVNALVQRISGDIARGTSRVDFGAPLKITGHDLIDAVRATRYRVQTVNLSYLFGGALGGGQSSVKFGRKTHARHTQHGGTHKEVDVVSKAVSPVAGVDPVVTTNGATGVTTWVPPNGPTTTSPGGQPASMPVATVDPSLCKGTDGNVHPVYFQEQKVCVKIGGVLKQRTLIAWTSDIYKAPDDPA